MPLFTINQDKLEPVPETSYAQEAILERNHLQNLLKQHIAPLGPDLMVICDEFSDWEDGIAPGNVEIGGAALLALSR
jgi:hypothetical protein